MALKTHLIPKQSESSTFWFGKKNFKVALRTVEQPGAGPSGSRTLDLYNLQPLGRPGQHYVLVVQYYLLTYSVNDKACQQRQLFYRLIEIRTTYIKLLLTHPAVIADTHVLAMIILSSQGILYRQKFF